MKCVRCHNEDDKYFFLDNDVHYCRKCIGFGRIDVGQPMRKRKYRQKAWNLSPTLDYALTSYQQEVSNQVIQHLKAKENVLVYAATGAGKTEIVMGAISVYLKAGKKIGIAIARRQVVLEIRDRMQEAFPALDVVAVCEGHTRKVDGDLIVCTMHQLYRYYQTFDLLIMDEVDAFPYYGNEVLEAIAMHSCIGEIVYLTATPDDKMKQAVHQQTLCQVTLFKRPHGKPLVVPKVMRMPYLIQLLWLYKMMKQQMKENQNVLIFVPTIYQTKFLSKCFSLLFPCGGISSKSSDKEEVIASFRNKEILFLFTTTVLERGITIKGVDVCVISGEHRVFTTPSLIQIFGRVGRSMQKPYGNAWLLCKENTEAIKTCIHEIQHMNESVKL